ncbi:MAG: hypothetical protein GWO85_01030 [Simkaniaceae bacterium]|nr:hypothetical protein [Simkaniaceae bacterium]
MKRLLPALAVLVNGSSITTTDENGEKVSSYQERSKKDLDRIAALVRSAVGYDAERGDKVEVQNLEFDRSIYESDKEYFNEFEKNEIWASLIDKGFIGIGILLAFFILRSLMKNGLPIFQMGAMGSAAPVLPGGDSDHLLQEHEESSSHSSDIYMAKLSPEAREKLQTKDRMTEDVLEFSKEAPEDAARIIRTWLMDNPPVN